MKTFPVIYKLTNTGAITTWFAEVKKDSFRTTHGQIKGAQTVSAWTVCIGTNHGRANYRDPQQQAVFEVQAEYTKKLKRDYHETEEAARESGSHIFEPMLAEGFDKVKPKHFPKFPNVYFQPKLDGMRCITNAKGMFSRTGEKIVSCPHIWEAVRHVFDDRPELVLDGELYNHGLSDNFDEVMSIFKRTKPSAEDFKKSREFGQYHIYDIEGDERFGLRTADLKDIFRMYFKGNFFLHFVETFQVKSSEEIKERYAYFMGLGYEGGIIRADTPYENKRTWALMKYVEFMTAEFKLLSILSAKGNWAGKARVAWLEVKTKTGLKKFKADIVGTEAYCTRVLKEADQYIGKPTTVRFRNYTPKGIPRFGKIKALVKEFDRRG